MKLSRYTTYVGCMLLTCAGVSSADPGQFQPGDIFVAVGGGTYDVHDRAGNYRYSLDQGDGGYTADCGFSPDLSRLVTTNYTQSRLFVFEDGVAEAGPQVIETGDVSPGGHAGAVVFDEAGNLFVGHPDGNSLIHKYSPGGGLMETFEVEVEERGSNWLDLAVDQSTVFYTSQGRFVHRYDTGTGSQLEPFAELPGEGHAQSVRLLAPGDGSGGLLVADGIDVKRLDRNGEVVHTYDLPDHDSWFAINLDPDGRTFWATDHGSDEVVRFGIGSGAVHSSFAAGGGNTVFGVCLKGEITAATQAVTSLPTTYGLEQNAPNPFNPETQITYRLAETGEITLSIHNLLGQRIRTLVNEMQPVGTHTVRWDGRDASGRAVSSGVYLYHFESAGLTETRRMLLLK